MMDKYWSANDSVCEICGVGFDLLSMIAEMFDPDSENGSMICHLHCGLKNNLWVERMVHPYVGSNYR